MFSFAGYLHADGMSLSISTNPIAYKMDKTVTHSGKTNETTAESTTLSTGFGVPNFYAKMDKWTVNLESDAARVGAGYNVSDMLEVGMNVGLSLTNSKSTPKGGTAAEADNSAMIFYPYATYTMNLMEKCALEMNGEVTYATISGKKPNEMAQTSTGVNLSVNYVHSFTDHLSYVAGLGYMMETTTATKPSEDKTTGSSISVNVASFRMAL